MWNKNKLTSCLSKVRTFSVLDAFKKKITKGLINRHDVDWSLDDAYNLSQLEQDNGINSTYYIRLNSELYNPKSRKNRIILKKMKRFFEIGLHFDSTIYDKKNLKKGFFQEMNILNDIIEDKIYTFSDHMPRKNGFTKPYNKNVISAYNKKIFVKKNYISDSRYDYRKNFSNYVDLSKKRVIYLLTHPEYYINSKRSYKMIINRILKNFNSSAIEEMSLSNKNFKKFS
jgi:hypothetical protein